VKAILQVRHLTGKGIPGFSACAALRKIVLFFLSWFVTQRLFAAGDDRFRALV
jgi:hypothetical protein